LTLADAVSEERADLVVAPDSRLDQLGLLPLTIDPARYRLWENVLREKTPPTSLANQLDAWCARDVRLAGQTTLHTALGFRRRAARSCATLPHCFWRCANLRVKIRSWRQSSKGAATRRLNYTFSVVYAPKAGAYCSIADSGQRSWLTAKR